MTLAAPAAHNALPTLSEAATFYVYKLTSDSGAAPCVHAGLLSLAICKPMIRAGASVGDVVAGFAGASLSPNHRLVYIARITRIEVDGDYYDDERYAGRGDRIYERGGDGVFRLHVSAAFHADGDHRGRDLGTFPEYEKATALLCEDFRYFGSAPGSPTPDLRPYPNLRSMLGSLRQGHRVNHPPAVARELRALWQASSKLSSTEPPGVPERDRAPGVCSTPSPREPVRESRRKRRC